MFTRKTSEYKHWQMFCFCIPLQYVCIFFGTVQLAWALNELMKPCVATIVIEKKASIAVFGICAALLIYGAIKQNQSYL